MTDALRGWHRQVRMVVDCLSMTMAERLPITTRGEGSERGSLAWNSCGHHRFRARSENTIAAGEGVRTLGVRSFAVRCLACVDQEAALLAVTGPSWKTPILRNRW